MHTLAWTVGSALAMSAIAWVGLASVALNEEQMKKLLDTGRTDLLTAFVSKKGRRFKAFLVKQPDGKIGFEFQPRAPKEKKGEKQAEKPAESDEKTTRPGSARRAR